VIRLIAKSKRSKNYVSAFIKTLLPAGQQNFGMTETEKYWDEKSKILIQKDDNQLYFFLIELKIKRDIS
jgi:hypothetical protein